MKDDPEAAPLPPRASALRDFAIRLTRQPAAMTEDDVEALHRVGLDDRAVLDVVEIVGFFNYINRVAEALGIDPEPEWPRRA